MSLRRAHHTWILALLTEILKAQTFLTCRIDLGQAAILILNGEHLEKKTLKRNHTVTIMDMEHLYLGKVTFSRQEGAQDYSHRGEKLLSSHFDLLMLLSLHHRLCSSLSISQLAL